ncbi:MAG: hypothetical protein KDA44_12015 [Planctomycetales bacterium]|nr:hypothetical protein [Planctomycetales bacterium]
MRTYSACLGAALAVAVCSGCALSWRPSFVAGSRQADAATEEVDELSTDRTGSSFDPAASGLAKAEATPPTSDEAFADVLGELRAIGAIDPAAERELLQELHDAKPEHYQLVVDQFRAALAYRKQLAARDAERLQRQRDDETQHAETQLAAYAQRQANSANRPWPDSATLGQALPADMTLASDQSTANPLVALRSATNVNRPPAAETASRLPPPPASLARARQNAPQDAVLPAANRPGSPVAPYNDSQVLAASHVVDDRADAASDWRGELDATITDMQAVLAPAPRTVDELHDHLRLRMLLMLAGRNDDALAPIPGANPAQQDFWGKQLFALSAYLDAANTGDERARAAATLRHLDDARDRLSDLATLQVRNATFVTRVDGFGLYEPVPKAEFAPGQSIIVYAEMVNFRSQSTAEGYETSLGTSYQVVDETGRRVDGAQFPDVQDVCQSRRHDFHMQYEMQLPTRIYPGPYQLQLIITDHSSNKIGQADLAFEIVDEPAR